MLFFYLSYRSQTAIPPENGKSDESSKTDVESKETKEAGRFMTILPQVCAPIKSTSFLYIVYIDLGLFRF